MNPVLIVFELLKEFAQAFGGGAPSFADAFISDMRSKRPDLCTADDPCAPPPRGDLEIDEEIDAMIDEGKV